MFWHSNASPNFQGKKKEISAVADLGPLAVVPILASHSEKPTLGHSQ
jgi:hypothetical protein